jgi:hypothetical protein
MGWVHAAGDLDAWLVHYNTERPHLGYRNQGRRPWETVAAFPSIIASSTRRSKPSGFHCVALERHSALSNLKLVRYRRGSDRALLQRESSMRGRAILILVGILTVLCACSISVPVSLYPVKGPYSEQKQKPVINAIAHDVQRNTGKFEVTLPDGEICEGRWSSAAGVMLTQGSSSLFTQYGSVVGF